jgi:hypothetical protein
VKGTKTVAGSIKSIGSQIKLISIEVVALSAGGRGKTITQSL